MKLKKIIILHQGYEGSEDPTIINALRLKNNLCRATEELGFSPIPVYLDEEFRWIDKILHSKPDIVFNGADLGFFYDITYEPNIPAVLDGIGIPYTGSDHYSSAFTGDKFASKQYLKVFGVPTPESYLVSEIETKNPNFPLVIKTRMGHNSVGMTFDSVVYNRGELEKRLSGLNSTKQELVLEEFIDGTETAAGFIGNNNRLMLPQFAIDFGIFFDGKPRILEYKSKWDEGSEEYLQSTPKPAKYPEDLADRINHYVSVIADQFNIRDYGRCDFRIKRNENGEEEAYVIDINTNPDVNDNAGFYRMATAAGLRYTQLIGKIIDAAIERYEK